MDPVVNNRFIVIVFYLIRCNCYIPFYRVRIGRVIMLFYLASNTLKLTFLIVYNQLHEKININY